MRNRQSCTMVGMSKDRWGEGNTYLRGETYWIHYSVGGKTVRESTGKKKEAEARKVLRKRLNAMDRGESTGAEVQRITVGDLLDDLKRDYERNEKSVDWAQIVINHLRPHFGFIKAARVGTDQIESYIKARSAKVAGSTINRELALLRRAFYLGTKTDPAKVARVPKIPKLPEGAARTGFFDSEMLARLVAELPPEIAGVAKFAYYTGCRKTEILSLRWDWVDLDRRIVTLPGAVTKNGESRKIPMVADLVAALVDLRKERDNLWAYCPWVFSRAGRKIRSFYTSWRAACNRADLPDGTRLLHDMRRSGVRNLVRAGVPERVAMSISGHKTRSIFDRYNITSETDLMDAVDRLEKFGAGKRT